MNVVGPTIMIHMVISSVGLLKLIVSNLGFNTYFALLNLWFGWRLKTLGIVGSID